MARKIAIGQRDFERIIENHYFYIDKTEFIREWWKNGDPVTLIARPRGFGKTLNMSMVEQFFSAAYAGRGDLFERFSVWKDETYRNLQGAYPVIALSFADVKGKTYAQAREEVCQVIKAVYKRFDFLLKSDALNEDEKAKYRNVFETMEDIDVTYALYDLSKFLYRYYRKNVIILLGGYDTPMLEACAGGYDEELMSFIRSMYLTVFKTNPWLERALLTGLTVQAEVSDLINVNAVTITSEKYRNSFGFTETEVFAALDEFGLSEQKQKVKKWYDGFTFGSHSDIYNPWSILNYLDKRKFAAYWANTSSNSLAGKLIREGGRNIKESFERLLQGERLFVPIDEQIVYNQLDDNEYAIWSLLAASGYLKIVSHEEFDEEGTGTMPRYELALTNGEVKLMFKNMVRSWFYGDVSDYNDFIKALLLEDVDSMNEYMNRISCEIFSSFDTGKHPSKKAEPERFYHGFVLGLMVELEDRYDITSNRESGFGRYDIMLEPKKTDLDAIIIEFKVYNPRKNTNLEDALQAALIQIEEKQYEAVLKKKGIPAGQIRKYGFVFEGKKVLIG